MNNIKQYIPFNYPAVSYRPCTVDNELIASRELKIKVLVTFAFSYPYTSIFSLITRRLAIMASPVSMGLFFLPSLGFSFAAIMFISSRFAQWDENRARNTLKEFAIEQLYEDHGIGTEWLVNNVLPIELGNRVIQEQRALDHLLDAAIKQKQPAWLHFIWKKTKTDYALKALMEKH